ncbi:hypothetical protein VNO77_02618 [Canavalia gladiata]|uniref:Uncharacterized protein n=1 Tax=Canavalia gladiata TaxID=3824 RepID=A0AAN9MVD7_CANGL
MKETSIGNAIANIAPSIVVQIILTLMLLFQVTNAFDWGCFGAQRHILVFENRMADDVPGYDMTKDVMVAKCGSQYVKLLPKGSAAICGGWFWDPIYICEVYLITGTWAHKIAAYRRDYGCHKEKECKWQCELVTPSGLSLTDTLHCLN